MKTCGGGGQPVRGENYIDFLKMQNNEVGKIIICDETADRLIMIIKFYINFSCIEMVSRKQ